MDTYLRLPGQVRVVLWTAHWASHREGPYLAPQLCLVAWNGEAYKYPLEAQLLLKSFLVQAEFEKREPYERCFQDFSAFLYLFDYPLPEHLLRTHYPLPQILDCNPQLITTYFRHGSKTSETHHGQAHYFGVQFR